MWRMCRRFPGRRTEVGKAAEVLARCTSPDGALVFCVERETERDGRAVVSFGFEGLSWHLHPDLFEAQGRSPEQVALDVVGGLINDRLIVVIDRSDDLLEYRILETIESELELSGTNAPLGFRFWSGRGVDRAELLQGSVDYDRLGERTGLINPRPII